MVSSNAPQNPTLASSSPPEDNDAVYPSEGNVSVYPSVDNDAVDEGGFLPMIIFGGAYDAGLYASEHPGGVGAIRKYKGWDNDISNMWARTPVGLMDDWCKDKAKLDYMLSHMTAKCVDQQRPCHNHIYGRSRVRATYEAYFIRDHLIDPEDVGIRLAHYVIIGKVVYNVEPYLSGLFDNNTGAISTDHGHPNAYLHPLLHGIIFAGLNDNATELFYNVGLNSDYIQYVPRSFP